MKRLVVLMLLAVGLSACTIRVNAAVELNEDESGSYTVFIGLDEEMRELATTFGGEDVDMLGDMTGEVPEGFTVEEYVEDGFEGVRMSSTFSSIEELNSQLASSAGEGGGDDMSNLVSNLDLTHDGDEFEFRADLSGASEGLSGAMGEFEGADELPFNTDDLADVFDIRFNLTLPGRITEHNADSVNGNQLTWELTLEDDRTELVAVSTTASDNSMLLIGGAAVIALAAIGGGVAVSRRRKKAAASAVDAAGFGSMD